MLNRVHHGHDPQTGLLAVATGSQTVAVWSLESPSAERKQPSTSRAAEFGLATQRSALRGVEFIAPGVLMTIHATGVLAAWRLPDLRSARFDSPHSDEEGAEAELLWEETLGCEPCIVATHGHYPDADFGVAIGGKMGAVALVTPRDTGLPAVHMAKGAHRNDVTALAFSQEASSRGVRLASAGRDRLIKVWQIPRSDAQELGEPLVLEGSEAWPLCLSFSHDGARLASGSMDNGVYLWAVDEPTDEPLLAVAFEHHGWIVDVAWTPDNAFVAAASWDNTIGIYEADGLIARYSYDFHGDYVSNLYFPPQTPHLVSASYDHTLGVWNWKEARLEKLLYAHTDWVLGLTALDDARFVTVSSDKTARVWRADDFRCVDFLGESVTGGFELGADSGLHEYVDGIDSLQAPAAHHGVRSEEPADAERAVHELRGDRQPSAKTPMAMLDEAVEPETFDEAGEELQASVDAKDVEDDAFEPAVDALDDAVDDALDDQDEPDEDQQGLLDDFLEGAPDDLGLNAVSSTGDLLAEELADGGEESVRSNPFLEDAPATQMLAKDDVEEALSKDRESQPQPDQDLQHDGGSAVKTRLHARLRKLKERVEQQAEVEDKSVASMGEQLVGAEVDLGLDSEVFSAFGDLAPEIDEPLVSEEAGNTTQLGMPSEVDAPKANDGPVRHSLQDRSGTLPGAKPLRDRVDQVAELTAGSHQDHDQQDHDQQDRNTEQEQGHGFGRSESITMTGQRPLSHPADEDDDEDDHDDDVGSGSALPPSGLAFGESTAAREVTLAQEFQTPAQELVEQESSDDDEEHTSRISGEYLGMLRSGKLAPGSFDSGTSGRLSPGDLDASDLKVPEVGDAGAQTPAQPAGPEVIETDFKDLWERRSAASAPGMGIIKRPLAPETPYKLVGEFETPHRWTYGVDIFPKTKLVASCGGDNTVIIWGFDGAKKHQFAVDGEGLNDVVFTPDGTMVLAGGDDSRVHTWLIPQKTLAKADIVRHAQLIGHESWISSLAVSSNGKVVMSGSFDGTARAWHLQDGELGAVLEGHEGPVSGVQFYDRRLMTAGHDGSIRIWNAAGLQIDQLDSFGKLLCIDASPAGYACASASGHVAVTDVQGTRTLLSHQGEATAVDILKNGAVATAGKDGKIHLYVTGQSEPFQTIELGTAVWALRRLQDYLAAGTDDGRVLLYKRG